MPAAGVGYNDGVNRVKLGYYVLRYLGPKFALRRAALYARHKAGWDRRLFAPRDWDQIPVPLPEAAASSSAQTNSAEASRNQPTSAETYANWKTANSPPFFFPLGQPPKLPVELRSTAAARQPKLAERIRLLQQGRCVYFFKLVPPQPVEWNRNPFDGSHSDATKTWTDLPEYAPQQGDYRMLWEPARAAWAIDLTRAPTHGLDCDAAELYWQWVDSWMAACPPFRGVHWKCGQEAAVRLLALTFGFWSLAASPVTTPARWRQFARLAWATAYRIAHYIDYAISQKNNHAISEACGLMLVGHLFPEFAESKRWWRRGKRVLAGELRRQIYSDGSYVQHSMNYQRVMLAMAAVAFRLAELHGDPFERGLYDKLSLANDFLFEMMDPQSGGVPNYGNNDGAHVLPLDECDFVDFRPIVQTVHYLVHRQRRLEPGPWDEDLLWLFGPEALAAPRSPREPRAHAFADGGYFTLRGDQSWALVRCHTYRDRPAHYDPLHLDLWYKGHNVLRDCGTFKYYIPGRPDLERYFRSIQAHNCVEIDGGMPVELASRFQFFPWPRCRARQYNPVPASSGSCSCIFENHDYDRAPWHVLHRRTLLQLPGDAWVVVDDLLGIGRHRAVWYWHLLDADLTLEPGQTALVLKTPAGAYALAASATVAPRRFEIVRGRDEPGRVQGFAAPYYGERRPIPVLEVEYEAHLPLRVVTALGPIRAMATRLADVDGQERWVVSAGDASFELTLPPPTRKIAQLLLECPVALAPSESRKDENR